MLAHKDHKAGREQTMYEHTRNVAALCRVFGKKIGIENVAEMAGYYHDPGKLKQLFLKYILYDLTYLKGKIPHTHIGAQYILKNFKAETGWQKLTLRMLAVAIRSHHGGLIDCLSMDGTDSYTHKIFPDIDLQYDECVQNMAKEMPELEAEAVYAEAVNEIEAVVQKMIALAYENLAHAQEQANFYIGLLERFLLSILLDADRYDTYCFYAGETLKVHEIPDWDKLIQNLEDYLPSLKKGNPTMNRLRREISDRCRDFYVHPQGTYRLMVPTGGAKTLSSLRFALYHARKYQMEHIYYIIPYTSIIDQNSKNIQKALSAHDVILEHHSNLDDDSEEHRLLTERWAEPAIILTTMVQFLDTLFQGGTKANRRMHSLARSVLIFDEIQTIPPKCIHMFNSAVNFLANICHSTIVLCTATQPELALTQYPILMNSLIDMVPNCEEAFEKLNRTEIRNECTEGGRDTDELAQFVLEKNVPNCLVIVNTKPAALKLYRALKNLNEVADKDKQYKIVYLSTNLCQANRMDILNSLTKSLDNIEHVICVSTQLIEAGIDISFSCVVRSVAGLDNIAQAAGRCNRHGDGPRSPVYVVNNRDEDLSRLPEIATSQRAFFLFADDFEKEPARFGNDMLSPSSIRRYFTYFYNEFGNSDAMNYPVEKERLTLYDLLSTNIKGYKNYYENNKALPTTQMNQAFEKAGALFCVIDQNTTSVLVPYKDGKRIILDILSETEVEKQARLLRKASRYTVNLYEHEIKRLNSALIPLPLTGGYALPDEYYSEEFGVVYQGIPEFLYK